jgi:ABC-type glycerol-3-phosphate transport system substrate-binding protein
MLKRLTRRHLISTGARAGAALGLAGARGPWASVRPVRAAAKQLTLSFWTIPFWKGRTGKEPGGKESDYYDWQIAEFQKQYPNVSVKAEFIPSRPAVRRT